MKMTITIEDSQNNMSKKDIDRLRRAMNVFRDIGFDIELKFTGVPAQRNDHSYPNTEGQYTHIGHERQLAVHYKNGFNYGTLP